MISVFFTKLSHEIDSYKKTNCIPRNYHSSLERDRQES
jgi:hypothetical protein